MRRLLLVTLILLQFFCDAYAIGLVMSVSRRRKIVRIDTIATTSVRDIDKLVRHVSISQHPVQMQVIGHAIKVHSPESQILPIYTSDGTFYVVMRLNKGTNWLSGLPKGKYLINNRTININ